MQNDNTSPGWNQPHPAPQKVQNQPPQKANAVQIVWQLLTYALWSWALTALSILLAATLNYYVADKSGSTDYEFSLYAFAAVICLVPFAFVADRFYAKNEPEQKHGFAAVVMVLSAVVVFLTVLGGFITAVLTTLSILVSPGDTSEKWVIILSSLIVSALGAILFVRVLNPPKLRKFTHKFSLIVIGIVAVAALAAGFGPFASEIAARGDKLIEENLPRLNTAIQDYARANHKLPKNLEALREGSGYDRDAQQLVSENLVEYRIIENKSGTYDAGELSQLLDGRLNNNFSEASLLQGSQYELCVTYKRAKGDPYGSYRGGDNYLSTYTHEAGRQCYKLRVYQY